MEVMDEESGEESGGEEEVTGAGKRSVGDRDRYEVVREKQGVDSRDKV